LPPFVWVLIIGLITIPLGITLFKYIPKTAVSIYDNTFKCELTKDKSALDTLVKTTNSTSDGPYSKTGTIGDTFGGTVGPFIALFAAFLTFLAFFVQYRANVLQRKDISLERFESKYFELIRLHKANVDEIDIANVVKGRKSFVRMYSELVLCYEICESFNNSLQEPEKLDLISLTKFSYRIFFFGIGKNSEKQMSFEGKELKLFSAVKRFLLVIQEKYDDGKKKLDESVPGIDTNELHRRRLYNEYKIYFKPFDGHISHLAHYYRHLFQTVKFVVENNDLDEKEKLSYLRIIRAQLTNHEQLMLYYNGASMADDVWFDKEYFTRYKMIHNIPLPLADFGIQPEAHPKIIKWHNEGHENIFEWGE
jgi:hypothetical protein